MLNSYNLKNYRMVLFGVKGDQHDVEIYYYEDNGCVKYSLKLKENMVKKLDLEKMEKEIGKEIGKVGSNIIKYN